MSLKDLVQFKLRNNPQICLVLYRKVYLKNFLKFKLQNEFSCSGFSL